MNSAPKQVALIDDIMATLSRSKGGGGLAKDLRALLEQCEAERAAEAVRADIGELVGPLIHEVTNLLNNLSLGLMLGDAGGDSAADQTERLQARINHVAGLVRQIQEYRQRPMSIDRQIDVNVALHEAVDLVGREFPELAGNGAIPVLGPTSVLPSIRANHTDVVRCILFLLRSAVKAARIADGNVSLSTALTGGDLTIRIQISNVPVPSESPGRLYDLLGSKCAGISVLELAAAKSIARRFNAKPRAEDKDGLNLVLDIASSPK